MPLDRINTGKFHNDLAQAQRSAKAQLDFIINNQDKLLRVLNGKKYLMTALQFAECKEPLTPKQLSYIDVIYEKTMKGCGFQCATTSYKPNNKNNLRF